MNKDDLSRFDENMKQLQSEYEGFVKLKEKLRPWLSALRIVAIYAIIGGLWIVLSDKVLYVLVKDEQILKNLQLYKGWFYVIVTGTIFYLIIKKSMNLYENAIDKILIGYEDLSTVHEELIAMNEELQRKNQSLREEKVLSNSIIIEASSIIIVLDRDRNIIQFNPYAEKLFGLSKDDIVGKNISEVFTISNDSDRMQMMFESVIADRDLSEKEMELRCSCGNCKVILWKNDLLHDINGDIAGIVSIGTDITERRDMENRLEQIAYYDSLTGLPNRAYLEEVATKAIEGKNKFAIINLDIDDFKHINETMGHSVGDTFIQHIGDVLSSITVDSDVVVRVSGDQFAMLISQTDYNSVMIEEHAEYILQAIRKPWNMNGQQLFLTASLGVSMYPEHGIDFTTLMQNADIALFHQKDMGKDGYSIFEDSMYQKTLKFVQMGNQLRTAIENQEFLLYYQPQYDLKSGSILGVEALIRWFHPEKGFIPPMEFIPYSEKTGYIIPISEWVLKSAISQKREWDRKGYPPIKIAINLSGYTFTDSAVFENICCILTDMEVRPGEIEIEVTETAVMMELDKAKACLQRLKEFGITIAMDDFGTGYSSLNYLQMLPFDILKIDREFIKNIDHTKECYIYKTVVELAHNMELTVVAEGIETKEQEEFLQRNHCDIGQGYYFCKPVPANELESMLEIIRIEV